MSQKNNLNRFKEFFILGQIIVLCIAVVVLFCTMALNHRERILRTLMSKLETSAETMASQLKANQVPFSAGASEHGVFIVNQNDGSMVIDRHGDTDAEKTLWERYRTKLIYEMQKQKRGWIVYPDKVSWDWKQQQKIIRYFAV